MTDASLEASRWKEEARLELRGAAVGSLGAPQAAALALAPRWTASMASSVGLDTTTLAAMKNARYLLEVEDDSEPQYIASSTWRALALAPALREAGVRDAARGELGKIAAWAPASLHKWTALACQPPDAMAAYLGGEVTALVGLSRDEQEPAAIDQCAAAIMAWVEAARPFEPLRRADDRTDLDVEIDRAQRTAGLVRRRARDRAYLGAYVVRGDQDAAVQRLLSSPVDWCMHFIGAGGCGKTMLIRHVVSNLTAPKGIPSARVDFDHLSPDFPFKDPAVFYENLATELAGWTTQGAESGLRSVRGKIEKLRLDLAQFLDRDPTDNPLFDDITAVFREFFQGVAGAGPLLLILDTCEELAKYRIDDRLSPALAKTFEIVERLRFGRALTVDELAGTAALPAPIFPGLRVLLAGRRLLARRGRNYDSATCPQPERAYLELHEVRGFEKHEAQAYLENERVDASYLDAILAGAPEVSDAIDVEWDPPRPVSAEPARYHPYDLHDLAMVAVAPDAPSPKDLAQARNPLKYIQFRILRRIDSRPLIDALPRIARLGHVDDHILTLLVDPSVLGEVKRALAEQEWVIAEPWGEGACSIEPRLLARFDTLYAERPTPIQGRAELRAEIDRRLAGDPARIAWQVVDIALRLRAGESLSAQWAWWLGVEQRLLRERGATWVADVMDSLLARGLPVSSRQVATVATVQALATLICVTPDRKGQLGELAFRLRMTERRCSPGAVVPAIEARIVATEIESASRPAELGALYAIALGEWATRDAQLDITTRYALRAAYLALVEAGVQGTRFVGLATPAAGLFVDVEGDDPDLTALGILVRGVFGGFAGRASDAETVLLALLDRKIGADRERPHGRFTRRHLSGSVYQWVWWWMWHWGGSLDAWERKARALQGDEWKLALVLTQLSRAASTPYLSDTQAKALEYGDARVIGFSALAVALAAAADGAIEKAQTGFEGALESPAAVPMAIREHAAFVRRYRLWEQQITAADQLRNSRDIVELTSAAAIDGLAGRDAQTRLEPIAGNPASVHALWRSLRALDEEETQLTLAWWRHFGAGVATADPLTAAHQALDAVEAARLAKQDPPQLSLALPRLPCEDAEAWVAVALRSLVLHSIAKERQFLLDAAERMGARRVAEIALDEAEMLALRLPGHARDLFVRAERGFEDAGDDLGFARARLARILLGRDWASLDHLPAALPPTLARRRTIASALRERRPEARDLTEGLDERPWGGSADIRAARLMAARLESGLESSPKRAVAERIRLRATLVDSGQRTAGPRRAWLHWLGEPARRMMPLTILPDETVRDEGPPDPELVAERRTVELNLPDELFATSWEAWLGTYQQHPHRLRRVRFGVGKPPAWSPLRDRATVIAPQSLAFWLPPVPAHFTTDARTAENARLVHLVATAREDFRSFDATVVSVDDPFADDRGPVVNAMTLRRLLAYSPLFLLQGTPLKETVSPRTAREKANAARRFGGELSAAGAAVLVVPSLPLATSKELTAALVQRLFAARDAEDLVDTAGYLRRELVRGPDARIADDVCLYAPGDWVCAPPFPDGETTS